MSGEIITSRTIEITTNIGCSVNCIYCPQSKIVKAYRRSNLIDNHALMSFDNFKNYLSSVPEVVDIHFSGFSEPFHNVDCERMITYAAHKGHKVSVFTTLDGVSLEMIERLSSISFMRFCIHLIDQDNLLKLSLNDYYLQKIKLIINKKINNVDFYTIGRENKIISNEIGCHIKTDVVHTRAGNIEINTSKLSTLLSKERISKRTTNTSIICRKHRMNANVLLPNGDLYLCCMDYSLNEKLGNLSCQEYCDILKGPELSSVYSRMLDKNGMILCRNCEYAKPGFYKLYS